MYYVIGGILLAMAVFLVVAVIMQNGKSHNLSGTIAGGAETFFGKTKGKALDRLLARWTTIIAIIFVLLVLVLFIVQEDAFDGKDNFDNLQSSDTTAATSTSASTSASTSESTTPAANAMLAEPSVNIVLANGTQYTL